MVWLQIGLRACRIIPGEDKLTSFIAGEIDQSLYQKDDRSIEAMASEKMEKEREDLELGSNYNEGRDVMGVKSNGGSRRPSVSRSMRHSSARHSVSSARGLSLFGGSNPFEAASVAGSSHADEEEELQWAALEKLPTYNRLRASVFQKDTGSLRHVDVKGLSTLDFNHLLQRIHTVTDDDSEQLLAKVRTRLDRYPCIYTPPKLQLIC